MIQRKKNYKNALNYELLLFCALTTCVLISCFLQIQNNSFERSFWLSCVSLTIFFTNYFLFAFEYEIEISKKYLSICRALELSRCLRANQKSLINEKTSYLNFAFVGDQ